MWSKYLVLLLICLTSAISFARKQEVDTKIILQKEVKSGAEALVKKLSTTKDFTLRIDQLKEHKALIQKRIDALPYIDIQKAANADIESEVITRSRVLNEYQQALELIPNTTTRESCKKLVEDITFETNLEKSFIQSAWVIRIAQELCRSN